MSIDPKRRYSVREAAVFLDVTEQTVQNYLRKGGLRGEKIGPKKKWHTTGEEIIRLLKEWGIIKPESSVSEA